MARSAVRSRTSRSRPRRSSTAGRSINEILAKHTGQPIERIAKDTERDRYLTALQAKEYGLVDEVVGRIIAAGLGGQAARAARVERTTGTGVGATPACALPVRTLPSPIRDDPTHHAFSDKEHFRCLWSRSSSSAAAAKSGRWISIPACSRTGSSSWARPSTTTSPTWWSRRCSSWPTRTTRRTSTFTSTAPAAA